MQIALLSACLLRHYLFLLGLTYFDPFLYCSRVNYAGCGLRVAGCGLVANQ
jgi:hypothetical protein